MSKTVTIMRGISGAGKSTYIRRNFPAALVCSADHYFINGKGEYKFDRQKLSKAHGACREKFEAALASGAGHIVVDNTNTTVSEMKGYIQAAEKKGYQIQIFRLQVDPVVAAARNQHGVPPESIQAMQTRFQDYPGEVVVQ